MPGNKRIVNVDKPVFKLADPNDPVKYRLNPQPATGPAMFDKLVNLMGKGAPNPSELVQEEMKEQEFIKDLPSAKEMLPTEIPLKQRDGIAREEQSKKYSPEQEEYLNLLKEYDKLHQNQEMDMNAEKLDNYSVKDIQRAINYQNRSKAFREDFFRRNGRYPTWEEHMNAIGEID